MKVVHLLIFASFWKVFSCPKSPSKQQHAEDPMDFFLPVVLLEVDPCSREVCCCRFHQRDQRHESCQRERVLEFDGASDGFKVIFKVISCSNSIEL